ncbi:MAG: PilZ domain-containing protein [Candidatus Omnitrophota bacterium]|nr:PilZ domain-containing protein [Candidatus Omnitrophota bacterium]
MACIPAGREKIMDERRIEPRWQINQDAELTVENGVRAISCIVEDISSTGVCVSLKRNLFDDVFSKFKLVLAQDFELNIGAQVAWRDQSYEKNIYGLSFNRIDDSVKSRIGEYVKKNFPGLLVKQWWRGV